MARQPSYPLTQWVAASVTEFHVAAAHRSQGHHFRTAAEVSQQGNTQVPTSMEAREKQTCTTLAWYLQRKQKLVTQSCGADPLNHVVGLVARASLHHLWVPLLHFVQSLQELLV